MSDFDHLSVNGIHSLLNVSKSIAYNNAFFRDSVVPDRDESICAHNWRKILKWIMMHVDDARPHNSRKSIECLQQSRARRVRYPNYSPDLVASDFFLFGYMKSELLGFAIWNREDLIYEIRRIFEEIPKVTFISVYASWMKRLK
jgi:hypothetical protein